MGRITFTDVNWTEGSDNMPGMVGNGYFIPKSEVDLAACTVAADGVTLAGNIAVKALGRINEVYITENSGILTDADQGEIDGKYAKNKMVFFTPGSNPATASFKRAIRNTPGIWIFKDTSGNWRVLGVYASENPAWVEGSLTEDEFVPSLDIPARIVALNGTGGARGGDRKGSTFEVESDAPHEALFMTGDLPVNA